MGWGLRGTAMVGAFALGLGAFQLGVDVSERPGISSAPLWTQAYYALGLFVLGGLDLGVPSSGPWVGRSMLWVAYFLAPLITTSAVIEAVLRAIDPQRLQPMGMRDHIVVVGMGRLGLLYVEALRTREPDRRVLGIDLRDGGPHIHEAEERFGVRLLCGDATSNATREAMRLDQAAGVVLVTDNDLTNLDVAAEIVDCAPKLADRVAVHLSDIGLKRTIQRSLRGSALHDPEVLAVRKDYLFNAHHMAAKHLVRTDLVRHFKATAGMDVVVLAGFGRFGSTILEVLQQESRDALQLVVIVDRNAQAAERRFTTQVGFRPGFAHLAVDGDADDPATWDRVEAAVAPRRAAGMTEPAYIMATDDDALNLRAALWIRERDPEARIVVRCFRASAFTHRVSAQAGLTVFGVSGLLVESMAELHESWFEGDSNR